ncbi:MAG: hypothetical protein ACYC0B_09175 [Gemmatimonadaceae bacterium]
MPERCAASCPSAHIAQVHEEFHRRSGVGRTLRPNQRVDPLPRLAFSFRQASQMAIARYLLLAFTPRAFADLVLLGGLTSRFSKRLRACP